MEVVQKQATVIVGSNKDAGRTNMSGMKRKMCVDCKLIDLSAYPEKKYCSFCDPDEYPSIKQWAPPPPDVSPWKEGYEAGYQQAQTEKYYAPLDKTDNRWRDVIIEGLSIAGVYQPEHDVLHPRKAIDDYVALHVGLEKMEEAARTQEHRYKIEMVFLILAVLITATIAVALCTVFG